MPSALPIDWTEVQRASEAGVDDETLSQTYGIAKASIRQRRKRGNWLTPRKLMEQAEIEKVKSRCRTMGSGLSRVSHGPSALELTAQNLAQRAESYSLNVFNKVSALAEKGLDSLPVPDSWKSFQIADTVARRAAGLDKAQQDVTVNLAMFQHEAGPAWTAESEPLEAEVEPE